MKYPERLKPQDTIGICAPSDGIAEEFDKQRLELAIQNLRQMGYTVIETASVRNSQKGRSTSASKRAEEFMQLMEDETVKLILFAGGGDFLLEMIPFVDWEKLKKLPPKWMQGFSDITGITFLCNTLLDWASIYCEGVKDYAMQPLYRNLQDALRLASGEEVKQESFAFYEGGEEVENQNPSQGYQLTKPVCWKSITKEETVKVTGRALGGCLDVLECFFGTKYDNIKQYCNRYQEDGIIWFLDCYEMTSPGVTRKLWQMKEAGYFDNCRAILLGRPYRIREDYDISFEEAVLDALQDLSIPIITGVDIGHVAPQFAMVNGAIIQVEVKEQKGSITTYFR